MGSHQSLSQTVQLTTRGLATAALISGFVIVSPLAFADDASANKTTWGLGIGAISKQEPYAGIDRDNSALPLLQVENRYFRVFGPGIEFKLPSINISDSQQLNFGIVGQYDGSGYEENDAPILNGMGEREGGFWAGAKMEWNSNLVDVDAEWLTDVSGNSDGQRFNLGLERTWQIGEHVLLTPRVGASWQDDKNVDYYFGVRDSEIRFDRPAYSGESAINIKAGVRGVYQFDQHHSVLMGVEVTSLADEIKDSPLVDRSTQNAVFVGYLYTF
ncbi:MipA/OmpV family protein [Vreelandella titanicae]|uniref:MipA/OmpV family protein n=1 Tax=Halomonadaceae TaxID=28256 RepID=UPI000483D013|nr:MULTISPECIES: MipA/OmpV family protein [unclassified Halomonas]KIN15852.1 structural protein MipA [Halomonas sp. KHS3]NAO96203.1 MipA/OmpV family protein [Halomonas sp. MG34]PKH58643.1 MipA/OmpV family protein [Halomonas sp. Choline-3u-9]QGQ69517.1 MipA/OmpV family protein [Halomonas sp. PA16-9]